MVVLFMTLCSVDKVDLTSTRVQS